MLRERRRHANYKPNRRLDRKSSRGMIYENEELRLRTININAEVERGQSDIRKLRRENEQLRREIWSLRDEYDRLDKLLRANKSSDNCENECGNTSDGADLSQSEDSDSCDTCRGGDGDDDEDCPENYAAGRQQRGEGTAPMLQDRVGGASGRISDPWNDNSRGKFDDEPQYRQQARQTEIEENYENSQKSILEANAAGDSVCVKKKNFNESAVASTSGTSSSLKLRDNLHVNFDHLSIVSEENLTNSSDGNSSVNHGDTTNLQQTPLPNDIPGSPHHTGLGQQSIVPPLSHFENIDYDQLGPNLESLDDINYGTSSTTTGETVVLANGWDFNVQQTLLGQVSSQSPMLQSQSVDMKGTSPNATDYHEIRSPIYMAASFSGAANILPSGHGLESSAGSLNATSNEMSTTTKSPKHFFSPIKPRLRINNDEQYNKNISQQRDELIDNNGPDLYVTNALATPYSYAHASPPPLQQQQQHHHFDPLVRKSSEPIYTSVQKAPRRACSPNAFQTGGNLEDLLMDIENLSKDILQMQLEKQKSYSQEKLTSIGDSNDNLCNNKPYRSEMNLVLTYNGSNPVITPIAKTTSSSSTTGLDMATNIFANCPISNNNFNNINSDMMDTPPPNLPEPMILFPQNLTYLGFEGYNSSGVVAHPILGQQQQQQHGAPSTIIGAMSIDPMQQYQPIIGASPFAEEYSNSPVPDDKSLPQEMTDVAASSSLTNIMLKSEGTPLLRKKILPPKLPSEDWPTEIGGAIGKEGSVEVLKSSIRSTPLDEIKKPLQANTFAAATGEKISRTESSASENANCDSSSGSEATKRKARRVSILFNGKKPSSTSIASSSGASPKDQTDKSKIRKDNQSSHDYAKSTFRYKEKDMTASTGNLATSPTDLQQMIKNPCTSGATDANNRTANSSHSFGQQQRRSSTTGGAGDGVQHPSHHHHHHHHGHGHSHHHGTGIGGVGGTRKLSQDSSVRGLNLNKSTTSGQRKCSSRRHSDGTVLTTLAGSGTPGSHNQHQILGGIVGEQLGRQNLLSSSSAGQIRDSYQDGGGPGGTSMSERNSNSLPSSRESSASFSTKSSRRKLSASSHSGGKIPWCGCWGNGCL